MSQQIYIPQQTPPKKSNLWIYLLGGCCITPIALTCAGCLLFSVVALMTEPPGLNDATLDAITATEPPNLPFTNASGQVYIAGSLGSINVRSSPSTSASVLGHLTTGTRVTITGESGQWYRIDYEGLPGWIYKSLTSTTRPQPQSSPSSSGGGGGGSGCPGFNYTCASLTCAQAQACLAAGNGRLDRDNDGTACDSQCQ